MLSYGTHLFTCLSQDAFWKEQTRIFFFALSGPGLTVLYLQGTKQVLDKCYMTKEWININPFSPNLSIMWLYIRQAGWKMSGV